MNLRFGPLPLVLALTLAMPAALAQTADAPPPAASVPAPTLDPVKAIGRKDPSLLPPPAPGGQVARGARLGNLGNVDTRTAPFSLKAYTAKLIEDQGARSIDDVIANDPSSRVSLSSGFVLDQSSVRGFLTTSTTYRFDGVPGLFSYSRVPVQNFERVELLKGPSTAVYGAGSAVGGTFNLVPKRATLDPVQRLTLAASSRSMAEGHVDVGRRFGPDNALGARLNVFAEEGTLPGGTHRRNVAPQLALDLATERVRVTLDAGVIDFTNTGYGLNYTLAAGQPVPSVPDPRHRQTPAFTRMDVPNRFGLLGAEVDATDAITVYAKHGLFHEKSESISPLISPLRGDGTYTVNTVGFNTWTTDNETTDAGVRLRFATAGLQHQLTVSSLRYSSLYAIDTMSRLQTVPPATPFTPTPGTIYADYALANPFAGGFPPIQYAGVAVVQSSWGATDAITAFDDRLTLVLGMRDQKIHTGTYEGQKTSPTVAASWKLNEVWTVYGNYATALLQGARAPVGSANAGNDLPPYVAKQIEGGLKWTAERVGATFAAFEIKQQSAFLDPADNVFKAAGEQRNRGIELDAFGESQSGLRVLGGVAYIDGRQTQTQGGVTDGKRALGVSDWNANLGVEVDLPAVPGLTATSRVIHTGDAYINTLNTQRLPSWTRLDLGLRYAMQVHGRAVTLRASVNNVADRAYWQTGGRNLFVVAEPRTWRVATTVEF